MRLRKLTLRHFCNVGFATLKFSGRQHIRVGANGHGKTSLLEAAGFITALWWRPAERRIALRTDAATLRA